MASSFSILRCSWDKRSMIMAALHTVNHNKLSLTRYQLLRQIKSGSKLRCGDFTFRTCRYETTASDVVNKRCHSKPNDFRTHWRRVVGCALREWARGGLIGQLAVRPV